MAWSESTAWRQSTATQKPCQLEQLENAPQYDTAVVLTGDLVDRYLRAP